MKGGLREHQHRVTSTADLIHEKLLSDRGGGRGVYRVKTMEDQIIHVLRGQRGMVSDFITLLRTACNFKLRNGVILEFFLLIFSDCVDYGYLKLWKTKLQVRGRLLCPPCVILYFLWTWSKCVVVGIVIKSVCSVLQWGVFARATWSPYRGSKIG